ncbi:MAG: hypothetical protein HYW79_04080 [Parcubacteria group bacterium]|nr:hypothetical protein [Parcubacteria group bacterium]
MNDRRRIFKRIFIAVIYLAIFSGVGTGIYFLVRPTPVPPPPPAPVVDPVEIIWSQVFVSGQDLYSIGAKIRNPNTGFGASFFTYTFYLYDASGNLLSNKPGESFIWPGESKYLIEAGIELLKAPVSVKLQLGEPTWREVKDFKSIDLTVSNIFYGQGKAGSGKFYEVNATAFNGTSYDLSKVYVSAVLFGRGNLPIAVNSTIFENLKSKERRPFSMPWFSPFSGIPTSVDLSISTNLFNRPELLGQ